MSNRTRAERRHHRLRMINRARRKLTAVWDYESREWIEWYILKNHSHMANCSCYMCGNPRRVAWNKTKEKLTMQERRVYNALCEGLEEYYDWLLPPYD